MQMQRRAAHRVQQMQAHSRRVFEAYQGHPPQPLEDVPWSEALRSPGLYTHTESASTAAPERPLPTPSVSADGAEHERWLIWGLVLLLSGCGCRTELMLALLYLAL